MKINKEYSTKDLERILNQSKSILANRVSTNKQKKSIVSGTINFYSPDEGFLDAYITDDMLMGDFDDWVKNYMEEEDEELTDDKLYNKFNELYYNDLRIQYEEFLRTLEPAVAKCNDALDFFEIEILDGYYEGLQLHINELENSKYYDEWEHEGENDHYEDDYNAEKKAVNRMIVKLAKKFGFKLSTGYDWVGAHEPDKNTLRQYLFYY